MTGMLILVRHGQSEWNLKNLFTGWRNVELTEQGIGEARATGKKLAAAGIVPDLFYTSALRRAQHTLDLILEEMGIVNLTITRNQALNERDYGDLSGLNKDDARAKWGDEQVLIWRRSYDVPPPGGESLKDTADRTQPYFEAEILPHLKAGKTVLVTAHGNSLRALVKAIEGLTPDEILKREIATGEPVAYRIGPDGAMIEKVTL
ncbi:phosphoglycerate mutase [Devosia enhydra]|uniref:2,3-bisphosphoglycerate-dependent phosphoglycerate mutase n=1 Tax=Devosia enhydra TaxID=665118 RepID=A0A1K2HYH4_9HYPH|nr:2,3-bisphosphoglycerate-dependent phosphoglycerate mutase [Devosia enhydra]SFZ85022.1 phosphoglycerate mutase [Devosia enhydra]